MDRDKLYAELRGALTSAEALVERLGELQPAPTENRVGPAHTDELRGDIDKVWKALEASANDVVPLRVKELSIDLRGEAERQQFAIRRLNIRPALFADKPEAPDRVEIAREANALAEKLDRVIDSGDWFDQPPRQPAGSGRPEVVNSLLDTARREIGEADKDKEGALAWHERQVREGRPTRRGTSETPAAEDGPKTFTPATRDMLAAAANQAQVGAAQTGLAATEMLRDYLANPVGSATRPLRVQMRRADLVWTPDTAFQMYVRASSESMEYAAYDRFMERVLCAPPGRPEDPERQTVRRRPLRLPFPDTDPYRFLKVATEVFMMANCGTWRAWSRNGPTKEERDYADRRIGMTFTEGEIVSELEGYLQVTNDGVPTLPYLALIRQKLGDVPLTSWGRGDPVLEDTRALVACSGIMQERLQFPCLVELIWSYWMEEGMLVQTLNAISRRFQNMRTPGDRDPLATLELDPLRPLNNFLWGYIQDEQHRLTVPRRAYEYDHHYGLSLLGRAVPAVKAADSRKRFLEAFHQLLHVCTIFYNQDDDTTVIADAFPVRNALREVHILLTQGAHNQYGDLPWTSRQEMLMQQWLLSRGEMREFLPGRIMVDYPEPWMDRVEAMKALMGWTDTSILHFRELAIFGERILLGIRFVDWTNVIEPERAGNWARFWRPEISSYIHAYRTVTGVDLAERVDATMPSTLLRQRIAGQRQQAR